MTWATPSQITLSGRVPGKREAVMAALNTLVSIQADIAMRMVARHTDAFWEGGHQARGGTQWAQLADSTVRRKKLYPLPNAPLIRTGTAMDSVFAQMTFKAHKYGANYVLTIGNSAVDRGKLYMGFHQFASDHRPARPSLEFTLQDAAMLQSMLRAVTSVFETAMAVRGNRRRAR